MNKLLNSANKTKWLLQWHYLKFNLEKSTHRKYQTTQLTNINEKMFIIQMKLCHSYPGLDCDNDHVSLIARCKIKDKKTRISLNKN